jgi:hypothetical protein
MKSDEPVHGVVSDQHPRQEQANGDRPAIEEYQGKDASNQARHPSGAVGASRGYMPQFLLDCRGEAWYRSKHPVEVEEWNEEKANHQPG